MWAFWHGAWITLAVGARPTNAYRGVTEATPYRAVTDVLRADASGHLQDVPTPRQSLDKRQQSLTKGAEVAKPEVVMPKVTKIVFKEVAKKHPVHEFDWSEVSRVQVAGCCIALFLCGVLCSAAGIGGGGIFLAILMLVGKITPHDAVPLSHAIVMLGAIGSLSVSMRQWVTTGSTDIDLDTCRMVVPASLLGTLLGFLMNSHVPDSLILKLLVFILTGLVAVVIRIWSRQRAEERSGSCDGGQVAACTDDCETGKASSVTRPELIISFGLLIMVDICSVLSFHMTACREEKAANANHIWGSCQHPFLLTFLGRRMQFDTEQALTDKVHFTVQWLPILLCISISTFYAHFMYSQRKWSVAHVATIQGMGWSTGVIAGLAGIGGGLIYSPFFLISMDPLVAVSTSTTCLLFIAASSTFQYALTDRIIMSLGTTYGAVVLVASICGTVLIRTVRHRLPGGKSHITFVVVTAVVLTNCLIFGKLLMQMRTHVMG